MQLPLRPEDTLPYDPARSYKQGDVMELPTYGVGIVLIAEPERLFVRLTNCTEREISREQNLLDRVRRYFK